MAKKILLLYAGGTIGMQQIQNVWQPAPGLLAKQMLAYPVFNDPLMPSYDILEMDPLLDSADMSPKDWMHLAQHINTHYDQYDGFVILHGTDTMAYSASALSFMLEGLNKPVILTGSQIPLIAPRNDAMENLVGAILFAANYEIAEVAVFFDHKLLRGNRSKKTNCQGFDAFESPNCNPLGKGGIHMELNKEEVIRPYENNPSLSIMDQMNAPIAIVPLYPGIEAEQLQAMLSGNLSGALILSFGTGNGPTQNKALMNVFKQANDRGLFLVNLTQCLQGSVEMDDYATGAGMRAVGMIHGHDLTVESALAKLKYLIGKGYSPEQIRSLMENNLKGELTRNP